MWLLLAFVSAALLGLYDTSKKAALENNAVLPVLFLNTLFSTVIFSPFIIDSLAGTGWFAGSIFDSSPFAGHPGTSGAFQETAEQLSSGMQAAHPLLKAHLLVILKSCIVLTSWIFGYFGLKHLPITIVGPINATRPILVLVGAMLLFGERLNAWQWAGVVLAMISLFLLSRSSRKENVDFSHKDFAYLTALNQPDAMISVVSLVRRGSVIISFLCGAMIFRERNLKAKALDLAFILIGMIFIWLGSK